MSDDVRYWIWLQDCVGYGAKTDTILSYFENARLCYNAGYKEWYNSGCFNRKQLEKMKNTPLSAAEICIENSKKHSCRIITPDSDEFPALLKNIDSVPLALYVKGNVDALSDELSLAMVGTRNVSSHGAYVADKLAYELSSVGFTIVSGGAIGVDSVCHNAVLRSGGRTVAVLGCGFGVNYLMKSEDMRKKIAEKGALVTEFQPGTPASRFTFPPRNRLISGMTLGTIVVEASIKSGSLITANFAQKQGRDVFAVPGPIMDNDFAGTNMLLRDGANFVYEADDIVRFYSISYSDVLSNEKVKYDNGSIDYTNTKRPIRQSVTDSESDTKVGNSSTAELQNTLSSSKNNDGENVKIKDVKAGNESLPSENIIDEITGADRYGTEPTELEEVILPDFVSDEAKKVFGELSNEPIHIDKLSILSGLAVQDVAAALTELEIFGCAVAHSGQLYTKS